MINKSVKINIGGEEREAKFTIGALEELEAMLPQHNAFELIAREHWSITEIVACVYCSLKVNERTLTKAKAQQWVAQYCREKENGMIDLKVRMLAALGICGLIVGDTKPFENILVALADETEDEEAEKK